MTSKPIKAHKFETANGQEIIFHELADGTYHACGTTRIYTKEQYEAGVKKLISLGGKKTN